ncbi:hypothetical protein C0989_002163 [Termitomyces sp. Mn162]|nr:hypothetical protein C0989_002163 [Termitomyces sp. Mn162]
MTPKNGKGNFDPWLQSKSRVLPPCSNSRLDEMHKGIDIYLGHKLSLGPDVYNVEKILEIGCGSCAWAIQAAEVYPEAIVNAIDKSALPPRPLPSNIRFMQLDVTESLPFEPASFDIIHARYVFVHVRYFCHLTVARSPSSPAPELEKCS